MSDSDTEMTEEQAKALAPKASGEHIHFGSLEHQEEQRLQKLKEAAEKEGDEDMAETEEARPVPKSKAAPADGIAAGIAAGNISVASEADVLELSEESKKAKARQEKLLKDFELKRRARQLAVPTNDTAVRQRLRELKEPVTLFGEREMERRDRLRALMVKLEADGDLPEDFGKAEEEEPPDEAAPMTMRETFYTEGTPELVQARRRIAEYSLPRAAERLARAKRRREDPDEDYDAECHEVLSAMSRTTNQISEFGDDRPLAGCALSPDGSSLVTAGWSGLAKLWTVPNLQRSGLVRGHLERITAVAYHPRSGLDLAPQAGNLATASADRTACLWSLEGTQVQTFTGHLDRLARLAFHPSGNFLGTASFDKTWRLWDVATGTELLLQEGHSRSVYGIAFHKDGSLVATCGLDALTRVWDLRTGRSIMALEGHVKPVLGVDFSPNGYHLATGSEDHTCRIWDLRKKKSMYIIPAHSSLISQVKYEPQEGYFLVTASYDNTARVWSGRDFKPVRTLAGHEGKIMGVDVANDGQYIATVSYDRTLKLWAPENP